jgi:hypothetical protein
MSPIFLPSRHLPLNFDSNWKGSSAPLANRSAIKTLASFRHRGGAQKFDRKTRFSKKN